MSNRSEFAAVLRDHLPKSWDLLPYRPDLSRLLERTTVMVSQQRVQPGQGMDDVTTLLVLIVDPDSDPATQDDSLEPKLDHLLNVFTMLTGQITLGAADRVLTTARQLGYEMPFRVGTTRDGDPVSGESAPTDDPGELAARVAARREGAGGLVVSSGEVDGLDLRGVASV